MMVPKEFIVVIYLLYWLTPSAVTQSYDKGTYCAQPYCGVNNLPCVGSRDFYGIHCVPTLQHVSLTQYRSGILKAINDFRSKVAEGDNRNLLAAARMARMGWSIELERFASHALLSCRPNVKYCMSSPDFQYIGNIIDQYTYSGKVGSNSPLVIMTQLIEDWTTELQNINRLATLYVPEKFVNENVAKTALLMLDRNTHVGCAALRWSLEHYNHFLFCCAFASDVFMYMPIYKLTGRAGSACKLRDSAYPALCAVGEKYGNHLAFQNVTVYEQPMTFNADE